MSKIFPTKAFEKTAQEFPECRPVFCSNKTIQSQEVLKFCSSSQGQSPQDRCCVKKSVNSSQITGYKLGNFNLTTCLIY